MLEVSDSRITTSQENSFTVLDDALGDGQVLLAVQEDGDDEPPFATLYRGGKTPQYGLSLLNVSHSRFGGWDFERWGNTLVANVGDLQRTVM